MPDVEIRDLLQHIRVRIVAPMTSMPRDYPTRVKLSDDSFVVLDQIRTISTKRVVKKLDIKLSHKQIKNVKQIIKIMLVD